MTKFYAVLPGFPGKTAREGRSKMNNYRFETLAVHAGSAPEGGTHAQHVPIYLTNAYHFDSTAHAASLFELKEAGNIYTRLQNPTCDALEARIAALEGGVGALAFASGHAAIFNTILNLAGQGDEIVSSICIYGGAINMLGVTLARLGIQVKFVDPDDLDAWEAAITDRTKALFTEAIGNPNANVADIAAIAEIAHRHGVPLIVDSTFTTPYLLRPIEFGADIVVHSATKFLSGQGTVMAGLVVDSGKFPWMGNPRFPLFSQPDPSYHGVVFGKDYGDAGFITRLRALIMRDLGACLSPFNAFIVLGGLETLALRMRRHCDNALAVAKYLQKHPAVEAVHYPGLEESPYHALQEKYCPLGAGSVFTFSLKGGRAAGAKVIDSVQLIEHVANVGDTRTLIIHPATTTHSQLTDEQLAASGITPGTIRLSVGIEAVEDILADLEQALAAAR